MIAHLQKISLSSCTLLSFVDKELLKSSPNIIKGIAIQTSRLNGNQNVSLSFDDVCSMAVFGLALGCQISEAEKISSTKLTTECVIDDVPVG